MNPQISRETEPATPLPATDLTEESILDIFKLTRDTRPEIWTLARDEVGQVPQYIEKTLPSHDAIIGRSEYNKPYLIRSRLDVILVSCIASIVPKTDRFRLSFLVGSRRKDSSLGRLVQELKSGISGLSHAVLLRGSKRSRPGDRGKGESTMHLHYETSIQSRVMYNNRQRILTAAIDNGLWFDDTLKLGPGLVVVLEGRRRDGSVADEGVCLGFMAMVHRIRKEAGIANPAVYGVSTDTFRWTFFRIDRFSKVSKSPSMGWEWGYSCHIVSLLQKIVKKSIEIAPAAREEKSGWMAKYGSEYRFTGAGFDEEPPVDWGDEDGEYASIEEEE